MQCPKCLVVGQCSNKYWSTHVRNWLRRCYGCKQSSFEVNWIVIKPIKRTPNSANMPS